MLKKTITYKDVNGIKITEDFYFNLTLGEIVEMELSVPGGLSNMIEHAKNTNDVAKLLVVFKDIILKSYGEKSSDGRRFIKSKELSTAFYQSNAYSKLYTELANDINAANAFIKGIVSDINNDFDGDILFTTSSNNIEIVNVIFNDPATIVFWSNGDKTVVKCDGENFDPEKGLAMAIAKHHLGNEGNYYNQFKKWLPEEIEESTSPWERLGKGVHDVIEKNTERLSAFNSVMNDLFKKIPDPEIVKYEECFASVKRSFKDGRLAPCNISAYYTENCKTCHYHITNCNCGEK